jgi:DNA-directed RNA polymerase I, II, and III subunit RPABC2
MKSNVAEIKTETETEMENDNHTDKDIIEFENFQVTYDNMHLQDKKRKTIPILTKYEEARIIGKRAMQISKGAYPLVDIGNLENPVDIALKELHEKKIPYIIRRPLPNGTYEDWRVDELRND